MEMEMEIERTAPRSEQCSTQSTHPLNINKNTNSMQAGKGIKNKDLSRYNSIKVENLVPKRIKLI